MGPDNVTDVQSMRLSSFSCLSNEIANHVQDISRSLTWVGLVSCLSNELANHLQEYH